MESNNFEFSYHNVGITTPILDPRYAFEESLKQTSESISFLDKLTDRIDDFLGGMLRRRLSNSEEDS